MCSDPWLDRWLSLLDERAGGRAVLELGCGDGRDTATLNAAGHHVIAIDLSRLAILAAKVRVPNATFYCQNILDPFPVEENGAGVIVASLSLHYFPWIETLNLVQRIRQTLQPMGMFLCRLNSTNDVNFGAIGHEYLSENYYLVDDQPKRFFDQQSVNSLFSDGWNVVNIEQTIINRYALPKSVWEVVLERNA